MVTSPKYSFIQFGDILDDCQCDVQLEVAGASEVSFYISAGNNIEMFICSISGDIIAQTKKISKGWITPDIDLSEYLACKDCFRFMIIENGVKYYSNVLIYDNKSSCPLVLYRSAANTFFPFREDTFNAVRLPIELVNKNPETETEEYVDANGWIHNTFKLRRDVYDLNINYCPIDFHKKIQVMLMHDVFIGDVFFSETGDYQIDYEEVLQEGKVNLYKASTKVSEQDILLMRNY